VTLIRSGNAGLSNRLTRYLSLPVLRALYGFVLSFGAPLGWIIVQWLVGRDPFNSEYFDHLLYLYMLFATAAVFVFLGFMIGKREQMITGLALSDSLTALYNKRYYKSRLEQEFVRSQRSGAALSVIQIDLDQLRNAHPESIDHVLA